MDLIVECSSGFLSVTGTEAGETVRSGYAVADVNAGLFAVIGIMMALRARENTGKGHMILMGHRSGDQDKVMIIDYVTRKDIKKAGGAKVRSRAGAEDNPA